jgi:predicted phosphodiesterase
MWTIDKDPQSVCAKMRVEYIPNSDWRFWVLVTSDEHIDNPHCDQKLLQHHMEQAKERGAAMIKLGDLIDGMQGKSDRRADKSALKDRHLRTDYLNSLVEEAVEFYSPYKENIAYVGYGNHEASLLKHYEFDALGFVARDLQLQGSPVVRGGYRGWIKFLFRRNEKGAGGQSINLYQIHGYGGGGPVTKDVIQANRKAVYLPDADIVVSGHTHDRNIFPIERIRLTDQGKEIRCTQHHVKTGTYKDEFVGEDQGFAVEKGMPPKSLGGYWLEFYYSRRTNRIEYQIYETDR